MQPVVFSRNIVNQLDFCESKEWLVTNGIGGYASGTIANMLTRRYHGLLIAALKPPLGRTYLVSKLDENVTYANYAVPIYTNRWMDGTIDPEGYAYINSFQLEGSIPVWTFAIADSLLEKRIWMKNGENTTYIQYHLKRASQPMNLRIKVLINHRDHHAATTAQSWNIELHPVKHGIRVVPLSRDVPFQVLCTQANFYPQKDWYHNFFLAKEKYRGLTSLEDQLFAGEFEITLHPQQAFGILLSAEKNPDLDWQTALEDRRRYEKSLAELAPTIPDQLCLAADQFIVNRATKTNPKGKSIIAGYPWFGDWGRDTMISLPGLTLSTGRPEITRTILSTFSEYIDQGMLPNRFPDEGENPEYNTVDATLWFFEALYAYYQKTNDLTLIEEIFPKLEEIIAYHIKGTRYQIHLDPEDGLLFSGEEGVQLTWMDAKVGNWVVTPRTGKAVEINALWYNALEIMDVFSKLLKREESFYKTTATKVKSSFKKFWIKTLGYLYDVIDSPEGNDQSLRPNQLFAISCSFSPLSSDKQKSIVEVITTHLLTPHGLRSLAPFEKGYFGRYGGGIAERDGAYHQGTVWGWLIGPFVSAHLKVYKNPSLAKSFITPLLNQLQDFGLGSIGEIFDGDSPFLPRGCIAQAWSVAEVIRVVDQIQEFEKR